MDKTIIFCVNQKHALDMKIAIDKYKTIKDSNYCVRVTSDEGDLGRDFLEMFQNNDRDIPTILTSSKMLTTGVDAKNVRNVVLTAPIKSMTEFKQIIGRGTRVFEGKDFFTIIDFVGATNLFYDDRWDGVAQEIIETVITNITQEEYETNHDDSSQIKDIDRAINEADLGVGVQAGSSEVRVIFPELTGERRTQLLKIAGAKLEEARVTVRGARDEFKKDLQAQEKNDEISKDENHNAQEEMQKMVEETNKVLEDLYKKKEEEIKG